MFQTRYSVPGSAPATLLPHSSQGNGVPPEITVIEYHEGHFEERTVTDHAELTPRLDTPNILWINIDGLGDIEALKRLGEQFDLHPLALEDVMNTGQRPKAEHYDEYLFVVMQMVYCDGAKKLCGEQVSMFFGKNFLITVQEEAEFDVFEPVRVRLRNENGRIRRRQADYLAYALMDSIIDHYYPVLEGIGTAIEDLETELIEKPGKASVRRLHELKRTLAQLRRFVWPARDVVNALLHDQSGLVDDVTKVFLRDCYDHTVQLMDLIESYREVTSGLMEIYLSSISIRTNEVMRVLTVISAIFIPLTFVAGVYGMNFQTATPKPEDWQMWGNMPELYMPYGYVGCLGLMAVIVGIQLLIFRKKRWI